MEKVETAQQYVTLKEDGVEQGVSGLWRQEFEWCLLSGFQESDARFILKMSVSQLVIEKEHVKEDDILEIRNFLASKSGKQI